MYSFVKCVQYGILPINVWICMVKYEVCWPMGSVLIGMAPLQLTKLPFFDLKILVVPGVLCTLWKCNVMPRHSELSTSHLALHFSPSLNTVDNYMQWEITTVQHVQGDLHIFNHVNLPSQAQGGTKAWQWHFEGHFIRNYIWNSYEITIRRSFRMNFRIK